MIHIYWVYVCTFVCVYENQICLFIIHDTFIDGVIVLDDTIIYYFLYRFIFIAFPPFPGNFFPVYVYLLYCGRKQSLLIKMMYRVINNIDTRMKKVKIYLLWIFLYSITADITVFPYYIHFYVIFIYIYKLNYCLFELSDLFMIKCKMTCCNI